MGGDEQAKEGGWKSTWRRAPMLGWAMVAAFGVWIADGLPGVPGEGAVRLGAWVGAVVLWWILGIPRGLAVAGTVMVLCGALHYARQVAAPGRFWAGDLPEQGSVVFELYGRVLQEPVAIGSGARQEGCVFPLAVEKVWESGGGLSENADGLGAKTGVGLGKWSESGARVWVRWKGTLPPCGSRVWMRAAVGRIQAARNPGQWDGAAYFHRMGLWVEAFVRDSLDGAVVEWPGGFYWGSWIARARESVVRELGRGLEGRPVAHALVASMVLGLRGEGLVQEQEWFRHSGTLHLFAVSGVNLAMLAAFLAGLARVLGMGPRGASVLVLPVLVLYAGITGGSASCMRALVMSVLGLAVWWVGRPALAFNSLGTSAFLLMFWDGNVLFRPAFLLSFWLVFVLALLSRPIGRGIRRWADPDALLPRDYWSGMQRVRVRMWRPVADAVAVSLAAWCASVPAAVLLFHEITPVAVLANLLVMPLAFVILSLGLFSVLLSPLGWMCAAGAWGICTLNRVNGSCAEAVLGIVRVCSGLPGAHWALADPLRRVPDFAVLDVGEGAAVIVRGGGKTFLLDCGRNEQVREALQPALRLYGVGELEGLFLSHGDVQHVGGARILLEEMPVRGVILPVVTDRSVVRRRLEEWLSLNPRIPVERVAAGWKRAEPGEGTLEVLYPPADVRASLADDKALVIRWSSPRGSLLYTADAGFPTELWLLRHCKERLAADVWVRGHHSREWTGGVDFVRAVSPRVIVVGQTGRRKAWEEVDRWADVWKDSGIQVFNQRETGAVEGFWVPGGCEARGFLTKKARVLRATDFLEAVREDE